MEEACSVKEIHKEFMIVPRNPPKEVFHDKAKDLVQNAIDLPLFNAAIVLNFLASLLSAKVWGVLKDVVVNSRNISMIIKNMSVVPKSVYVERVLKSQNVGHIHAHWAGTTSTMAYVIHRLSGIPYSFTLHRWDIYENNMLKEKVRAAAFARCISAKGKNDTLAIVGKKFENKVRVVHVGVKLPVPKSVDKINRLFTFMTPANLLPVKGHRYLIDACEILKSKGLDFRFWIVGDGPLEEELKKRVEAKGIADKVVFWGRLPHEKVIQFYKDRLVDLVVLPSIRSDVNESEGIPVALMEAMSYGIAVISTDTGAIEELIGDGSGMVVPQKNEARLAQAILTLAKDEYVYEQLRSRGRRKIEDDFDIAKTSSKLVDLMTI